MNKEQAFKAMEAWYLDEVTRLENEGGSKAEYDKLILIRDIVNCDSIEELNEVLQDA